MSMDRSTQRPNGGRTTNLPSPSVPAIIDPDDPDGLVATGSQLTDLEIRVPLWPVPALPGETDRVDVYWSSAVPGTPVASQTFPGPIDPAAFPFPLYVNRNLLQPDATYQVWYRVTIDNGSIAESERQNVTFDTRPPAYNQQLQALLLPADLPAVGITEAYLASHSDRVELQLPTPVYLDAAPGDVVTLYWSRINPPVTGPVVSKTVTQAEIDAGDIRIDLPGDAIRAADQDGLYFAVYKVRDRAGNETLLFSIATQVGVALKPLPGGDLPEPVFPDATLQGYINCEHEPWHGIRVRIEFVRNLFEFQDQITLFWQGYRTLNGRDPIPGTEGTFARTVSVQNVTDGYLDILVEPYVPHIEPMEEGSALAQYRLVKSTGQSGVSEEGLVKINRKLPGGEPCGPTYQGARSASPPEHCSLCHKLRRFIARLFRASGGGGR